MSIGLTSESQSLQLSDQENEAMLLIVALEDALEGALEDGLEISPGFTLLEEDPQDRNGDQVHHEPPPNPTKQVIDAFLDSLPNSLRFYDDTPGFFIFQPPEIENAKNNAFGAFPDQDVPAVVHAIRNHHAVPGFFPYQQTDKLHLRVADDQLADACGIVMSVIFDAARTSPDVFLEFKVADEAVLRTNRGDERAERILQQAQITLYAWQNVEDPTNRDSDVFSQVVAEIIHRFRSFPIAPSPNSCPASDLTVNEYCSFRQDRDDNTGNYFDPRDMSGRELAKFKMEMERRPLYAQLLDNERGPGTMPVPDFTEKAWRKVRPDSLKKHGVAKAVKQFKRTCQKTASRLFDADEIASYIAAIANMSNAIEAAQGDTKGKKGHDAVKELLNSWRDQLEDYKCEVEEAEFKSNLWRATDAYHTLIGDNVDHGFEKVIDNRNQFTAALEDGNLLIAAAKYDLVQKDILDVESALSKKSHKRQADLYGQRYNVASDQIPEHPDKGKWRAQISECAGLLEEMDAEFAKAEHEIFSIDGEPTGGDEHYKQVITQVHQRYKEIALKIRNRVPEAKAFAQQAAEFLGNCNVPELVAESDQLDQLATAAVDLNSTMMEFEQQIVDLLEESRNQDSRTRKRAKDAGITEQDDAVLLAPFMNVASKHSKACLTSLRRAKLMVYDGLLTLVERFQVDAANDELSKMTGDQYRVQSSLG